MPILYLDSQIKMVIRYYEIKKLNIITRIIKLYLLETYFNKFTPTQMGSKNSKETNSNDAPQISQSQEKKQGQIQSIEKSNSKTQKTKMKFQVNKEQQRIEVPKLEDEQPQQLQITFYKGDFENQNFAQQDQSTVFNNNAQSQVKEQGIGSSLDANLDIHDDQLMDVNGCRNKLRNERLLKIEEHDPIIVAILDDLECQTSSHHPSNTQAKLYLGSQIMIKNRIIAGFWNKLGPYKVTNFHFKPFEIEDNQIYYGEWFQQKRNGFGFLICDDFIYEGYWLNDVYHGDGRMICKDGNIYIGEFRNGLFNGDGFHLNNEQIVYEGEWENGHKNGIGKEQMPDGSVFIGQFQNNQRNGQGKLFNNKEQFVFEGQWIKGKAIEEGKVIWQDGRKFEGKWCNGMMHGHGTFIWPGGKKYIGNYVNNVRDGYGEYYYPDGKIYKGMWKKGLMHGQGIIIYPNNSHEKGQWQLGKRVIVQEKKANEKSQKKQENKAILPL
ncbi:unnamed protein product [Paramecium pentaurelia]|uniref:MORN repeat protein n=1 Tax=Paramecium pentaurelia TaxID=43138 RepID=A0A8S1X3B8_9CILI|nr:unnamed protein product [Paramecium pentaurelia]